MRGVLIVSVTDQEYGASVDLQQLYPFRMRFRFIEVGPVEAEKTSTPIPEPSGASGSNQPPSHRLTSLGRHPQMIGVMRTMVWPLGPVA
jgi:hypothetical protein